MGEAAREAALPPKGEGAKAAAADAERRTRRAVLFMADVRWAMCVCGRVRVMGVGGGGGGIPQRAMGGDGPRREVFFSSALDATDDGYQRIRFLRGLLLAPP